MKSSNRCSVKRILLPPRLIRNFPTVTSHIGKRWLMFTVWLMKRCYVLGILWWKALVQNIMWINWPSFLWVIVIEQSCVLSPFSYSQITSLKKKMKDYFLSNRRWHFFLYHFNLINITLLKLVYRRKCFLCERCGL